jgi:transposase
MVFVDVQPIAVKAYGGRRYTTARRLVLERRQKTRGRFYLFGLYEVNTGRVRWQFRRGKGAADVCAFLRRVRQWYPHRRVCVVLDQDPAHPRRAAATRRAIGALGLHWISLPKGSPDDNPVETVFSDIQLMVLDHSNDPDARTLQRRISARLRHRNRRRDRFIRIGYLGDIHNHR